LYASSETRAPIFLGVQGPSDERLGVLIYPFRVTHRLTRNRPTDEHRLQIRYGAESSWGGDHILGRDVASVDITLVLGIHIEAGVLVGLDPYSYDPLPMGISIELKDRDIAAAKSSGWHVIERENLAGSRRPSPRTPEGLETIVAFRPERLLDYVRLERHASDLGLDPALRYTLAAGQSNVGPGRPPVGGLHDLEREFDMSAQAIMEVIAKRTRLSVAVRGGVAEYHLERALRSTRSIAHVRRLDEDGRPDFDVTLADGRRLLVECKNCSPRPYANGDLKVEVQKTRATQGDPAGRLYRRDQFDAVAACLFPATGRWEFRFKSSRELPGDGRFPDRLAAIQRIDAGWATDLKRAV
jgi:hypothetical protein